MSEIKTQIIRSEREISSRNLVVRNYSEQLKSAVISDFQIFRIRNFCGLYVIAMPLCVDKIVIYRGLQGIIGMRNCR